MNQKNQPNGLQALALEADTLADNETKQPDQPEPPKQGPTNADMIAVAIGLGRDVFCTASTLQSPKHHLNEAAVTQLGEAWGAVCDKRGWDLNKALGDWGAEIGAIVVTAQIGYVLRTAVMEEIAARKAKPVEAETVETTA